MLESTPPLRKTVSVPVELSLITATKANVPPTGNTTTPVANPAMWTGPRSTDTDPDSDAEADEARRQQRCVEEVAAKLDFSHSLLPNPIYIPKSEAPLPRIP